MAKDVVQVAVPPVTDCVAQVEMLVPPLRNATVPPVGLPEIVAVKVTEPLTAWVAWPELTVVVVVAVIESLSVAELLLELLSVTPDGAVTVAVLDKVPVADDEICAATVNVTEPPLGRLTDSLILPVPDALQVPPPAPTHVHDAELIEPGSVSATVAPDALLGPLFDAVMV